MWEISNYNQLITILLSCLLGAICCAVYDIVRAVRRVILNSFFAITLGDILLWIVFAFLTFIFLIARTNGEIRGYVIFGEFVGFMFCRATISKLLYPALSFVFEKIYFVNKLATKKLYDIYNLIEMFILKTLSHIVKIFKSAKKGLKNICGLLYTNKNIINMEKILDEKTTEA